MSLFDTSDFVNVLVQLSGEPKKVSQQTLYNSLGLEYDEERRKIRKEDIAEAVRKKEMASLDAMALNELRSLNEDDEIPEVMQAPLPGMDTGSQPAGLPGQDMSGAGGMPGGGAGMGGLPGGGGGGVGLPPLPPMPGETPAAPPGGPPGAGGAPPTAPPPA